MEPTASMKTTMIAAKARLHYTFGSKSDDQDMVKQAGLDLLNDTPMEYDEFKAAVLQLEPDFSDEEIRTIFDMIDYSGDGKAVPSNFLTTLMSMAPVQMSTFSSFASMTRARQWLPDMIGSVRKNFSHVEGHRVRNSVSSFYDSGTVFSLRRASAGLFQADATLGRQPIGKEWDDPGDLSRETSEETGGLFPLDAIIEGEIVAPDDIYIETSEESEGLSI
jgi:hypothetical protein